MSSSSAFYLPVSSDPIRLLQISDPHLFAEPNGTLLDINTYASFQQVVKEIQGSAFPYEAILATGDLVQDGKPQSYQRFCETVKVLQKPVFWTTGNHDYQPNMYKVLATYPEQIIPHKHIYLGDHWQLLLLDSQVYGVPHGELSQVQLDWLNEKLATMTNRYTMIALHHHLISTQSAWLDQHNLRNTQALMDILTAYNAKQTAQGSPYQVKAIMYGHIHQEVATYLNDILVLATPSTAVQFKPHSNQFALDSTQPGWRELSLFAEGRILTQVKRITEREFFPNQLSQGY